MKLDEFKTIYEATHFFSMNAYAYVFWDIIKIIRTKNKTKEH